jgi:hypothetical protein
MANYGFCSSVQFEMQAKQKFHNVDYAIVV